PLNDGASALVLMSRAEAERRDLEPLARFVAAGAAGVHPDYMGIGPVPASARALDQAGLTVDDVELFEINEAFAAQSVACVRLLGIDEEKVNVNGGAIALGHPLGSSGSRLVSTLVREMGRRGARFGVATMCIGVGQGIASVWERARSYSSWAGPPFWAATTWRRRWKPGTKSRCSTEARLTLSSSPRSSAYMATATQISRHCGAAT